MRLSVKSREVNKPGRLNIRTFDDLSTSRTNTQGDSSKAPTFVRRFRPESKKNEENRSRWIHKIAK